MPIVNIQTGSPEWHEYHKGRIGGHAACAILLGGNPEIAQMGVKVRGTPLSVFLQLTGRLEKPKTDEERTEQEELAAELQWGLDTEDLHRRMLARDLGCEVHPGYCVQHPKYDWIMASVDGEALHMGHRKIVEMKAPTWAKRDWRDSAPWAAKVQCAFYMMVVAHDSPGNEPTNGIASALLPPTVSYEEFDRDPAVEEWIMGVLLDFKEKFIDRDTPPPPMGQDVKIMQRMWPKDTGKVILLPSECEATASRLEELREQSAQIEKEMDAHKVALMAAMGDATEATVGGYTYTWKTQTRHYKAKEASTVTTRVFTRKGGRKQ